MKLLFVVCLFASAFNINAQVANQPVGKTVGPGVTWRQETVAEGPLSFNVMRVQLDDPRITIEAESAKDKLFVGEKVHQSAEREAQPGQTEIIGAVNGDFYSLKNFFPIGLLVADGMIYDMPSKYRSAFVLTKDETPYIGPVSLDVSLKVGKKLLKIDRINSGTKSGNSVVLFTPPYGAEVEPAKGKRFVFTMKGTEFLPNQPVSVKVFEVDSASSTPLTADTMVLHIPPGQIKKLAASNLDSKEGILSALLPEVSGVIASVCGGGPAIVAEGKINVRYMEEKMEKAHLNKHPRTAVGFTKDKKTVYLVTVDGRQPRLSVGLTLDELAEYMKNLGCWAALNLDGGGSTSMVVNGKVVNSPSDLLGPRTVANSLLVVALVGGGAETSATLEAGSPTAASPRNAESF